MLPAELLERIDSYAELDEILAYDRILNEMQEARLNEHRKPHKKK